MGPEEREARRRDPSYNPQFDDPEYRKDEREANGEPADDEIVVDAEDDEAPPEGYEWVEEGENNMTTPGVGSAIGGALAAGAKQAAAAQVNDMLTEQATKMLISAGVLNKDAQHNMAVQIGLKAFLPMLILWMAEKFPDQIPQSALVGEGAKLALTSASAEVIQPAMMMLAPMLKQLASAGAEQRQIDNAAEGEEVDLGDVENVG